MQLVSRRLATALIVVLTAALGARMAAGGRPSGGPSGGAQSGSRGTALVTRIVDGDTAVLEKLGESRFIGVDTPEVHGRAECFGAQASAFAKRVLTGRRIRYSVGMAPRDRYGRALIYVWLQDGRSFNELLVRLGYARPLAIAPNVRYASLLRQRAREARADGHGLWSACP